LNICNFILPCLRCRFYAFLFSHFKKNRPNIVYKLVIRETDIIYNVNSINESDDLLTHRDAERYPAWTEKDTSGYTYLYYDQGTTPIQRVRFTDENTIDFPFLQTYTRR
jgi:hypothetical protein